LRAILNGATDDGLVNESPVRVRGAGKPSAHRSIEPLTPEQVQAITDAMPERWRLGVPLGAWMALRVGEIRELRRKDVDADKGVIRVCRAVSSGISELTVGDPKTSAGRRVVRIPPPILGMVATHLAAQAQPGADGLLFWHDKTGGQVPYGAWRTAWMGALRIAGVPSSYRFHDLRHTGLTYAAVAGATIRELQAMAGHTTALMAMRYQEVAADHMAEVVGRLGEVIPSGRNTPI
jgi:integrase